MNAVILLFTVLSVAVTTTAQAKDLPAASAAKISGLEKSCVEQQFGKAVCACVTRNMKSKAQAGDFNEAQLAAAITVMQKTVIPDGQTTPEYEHIADYLAGLQFHCHENPKYSID